MASVDVGGVTLSYEVSGPASAPPLVFLHGLSGCKEEYDAVAARFEDRHCCYRVDLRGHGASDHVPGGYRLSAFGGDVAAFVEHTVGRPAIVAGHSLGGAVAAWVGQERPDLVAALLLEDPASYLLDPDAFGSSTFAVLFGLVRAAAAQWRGAGFDGAAITEIIAETRNGWSEGTLREAMTPDSLDAAGAALATMDLAVFDAALDGVIGDVDVDRPITAPGRVLAADPRFGAAFLAEHAARLAVTSPGLDVVFVQGAGHNLHGTRAFREVYVQHLAEVAGRSG
jgi:pimeloyl-ACP methyl ester carboxylesterase